MSNPERDVEWTSRNRCYGISRDELHRLRKANSRHLESRLPAVDVNKAVGAHLRKHGRSTARGIYNKTGIFMPDIRQALARLVDEGVVKRDGEIWEKSTQTGHRNAAAYVWRNKPGKKKRRGRGRDKKK